MNIIDQLNQYEADHPIMGDPGDQPNNVWEDLIFRLPGYDEVATEKADPKSYGDRFVAGGVLYRWDQPNTKWRES